MKLKEHYEVITGKSTYLDDINLKDTVYLGIVRSSYARARIVDISKPSKALLFLTSKELKALLPATPVQNANIVKMPVLADGMVNFYGQPIAAVVVEDRYETEDIVEEVKIDYEVLQPVVTIQDSLKGNIVIHQGLKSNIALDQELKGGELSLAKDADVVVEREIYQERIPGNPMEPRGILAYYDGDRLLVYASTQSAFRVRNNLQEALGIPPDKITVIAPPNVGGGFGSKLNSPAEYIIAAYASMKLRKPVKWIETRYEHLIGLSQGRGVFGKVKLYGKKDGTLLGIEGEITLNLGAYAYAISLTTPSFIASNLTGPYTMKFARVRAIGVYTNLPPYVIYRGAGRPEATLFHETLIEDFAEKIGMDSIEIRRKNMVKEAYVTPLGLKLDKAGYAQVFEKGVELYKRLKEIYKDKGIGVAFFAELIRTSPGEGAKVRVGKGKVEVIVGSGHHGQAYQSSFSNLIQETFGIDGDKVIIRTGTTEGLKEGVGSYGSRAAAVGGSAIIEAFKALNKKLTELNISLKDAIEGNEIYEAEVYLKAEDIFTPSFHLAVVDIDKETYTPKVIGFYAVDDVGRILVKDEVEGQIVGGALQGISQVTLEAAEYDENGVPKFSSVNDVGLPTALESFREAEVYEVEVPSALSSGARGVGESGTIGGLAATFIALEKLLKVRFKRTPVTSSYINELIEGRE
ncbi:molybdopterin-dependent oxidoreductase [Sulfolobus sp. E5-1-F]|uniref:xanthine dehydrogenase family protein molybdopterin-binding subunit n=1 Tax=Saccharolobus sp. E5-1-F TaxID=2663019 RepID=UPI0012953598|nr:xanthine dehydrogenase family protein molybdopterin-binding subunit [Sulfolobus sp. E5-1-F]QGA54010.1 molybdopterin-dependent oxidoreductase [Sulfolobus sp. E5-1-F]